MKFPIILLCPVDSGERVWPILVYYNMSSPWHWGWPRCGNWLQTGPSEPFPRMPGKGMSLAVQCTSTTGGEGLSPGWRTKTPHATWPKKKLRSAWWENTLDGLAKLGLLMTISPAGGEGLSTLGEMKVPGKEKQSKRGWEQDRERVLLLQSPGSLLSQLPRIFIFPSKMRQQIADDV